jgi:hypothetical protein
MEIRLALYLAIWLVFVLGIMGIEFMVACRKSYEHNHRSR